MIYSTINSSLLSLRPPVKYALVAVVDHAVSSANRQLKRCAAKSLTPRGNTAGACRPSCGRSSARPARQGRLARCYDSSPVIRELALQVTLERRYLPRINLCRDEVVDLLVLRIGFRNSSAGMSDSR